MLLIIMHVVLCQPPMQHWLKAFLRLTKVVIIKDCCLQLWHIVAKHSYRHSCSNIELLFVAAFYYWHYWHWKSRHCFFSWKSKLELVGLIGIRRHYLRAGIGIGRAGIVFSQPKSKLELVGPNLEIRFILQVSFILVISIILVRIWILTKPCPWFRETS